MSPDSKRIAYYGGRVEWDLLEVSLPGGLVHPILVRGGVNMYPDWAPSGTHFLFATDNNGTVEIENHSSKDGFSRRLISQATEGLPPSVTMLQRPRWAPDGERFAFETSLRGRVRVWLSTVAGGRAVPLDAETERSTAPAWSPDGQWIAYIRQQADQRRLAKIRPGTASQAVIFADAKPAATAFATTEWSPAGGWILYPEDDGLSVISSNGKSRRKLTTRQFSVHGFSKDGGLVLAYSTTLRQTARSGSCSPSM